jgi:hypothetical protein
MSLKDRIRKRSAEFVRREPVLLPVTGETVTVRGMMFGEKERIAELTGFKQSATMLALCVEDPESGKPVWNASSLEDHEEIAGLPIPDTEAIVGAINRLSGFAGAAGKDSPETPSSSSPSPEFSEAEASPSGATA